MSLDFNWRVEEACLNAWPASHTALLQGWLLRASPTPTRRTNSLNATRGCSVDLRSVLAEADAIYAALGKPLIVRATGLTPGLDAHLDAEEFEPAAAETVTLHAAFGKEDAVDTADVVMGDAARPDWLAARARFGAADDVGARAYEKAVALILGQRLFASCRVGVGADAPIASVAYGVVSQGLLVLESVATDPEQRGNGLATRVVAALMRAAQPLGATSACLQVMSGNASAIKLYRRLGFDTELYRYHYRTAAVR